MALARRRGVRAVVLADTFSSPVRSNEKLLTAFAGSDKNYLRISNIQMSGVRFADRWQHELAVFDRYQLALDCSCHGPASWMEVLPLTYH